MSEPLYHMSRLEMEYGCALPLVRNSDLSSYLAVLVRVAQVNEISLQERNIVVPIAHDLQASQEETVEALLLADGDAGLAQLVERLEHPAVKLSLYRDACKVALADGLVDAQEMTFLDQLSEVLGLDGQATLHVLDDLALIRACQDRFRGRLDKLVEEHV